MPLNKLKIVIDENKMYCILFTVALRRSTTIRIFLVNVFNGFGTLKYPAAWYYSQLVYSTKTQKVFVCLFVCLSASVITPSLALLHPLLLSLHQLSCFQIVDIFNLPVSYWMVKRKIYICNYQTGKFFKLIFSVFLFSSLFALYTSLDVMMTVSCIYKDHIVCINKDYLN